MPISSTRGKTGRDKSLSVLTVLRRWYTKLSTVVRLHGKSPPPLPSPPPPSPNNRIIVRADGWLGNVFRCDESPPNSHVDVGRHSCTRRDVIFTRSPVFLRRATFHYYSCTTIGRGITVKKNICEFNLILFLYISKSSIQYYISRHFL